MENKQRPQVSIIMPCFNAENDVRLSISSVINNRIASKCELIIINDGSTDNTDSAIKESILGVSEITIKYKKTDNFGVSNARNAGMDLAEGEYIVFLDSDDQQSVVMLETLLEGVSKYKTDLGFCLWTSKIDKINGSLANAQLIDTIDFLRILLYRTKPVGLWSVIFRKELLDKNKIRFSTDIKYGEDLQFLWKAAMRANAVVELDEYYYFYKQSSTSAMKKTTWRKTEVLDVMKEISLEIREYSPSFANEFEYYMIPRTLLSLLKDFSQSNSKNDYYMLGKEYDCKNAMRNIKYGGIMVIASAMLYYISPTLFYVIFRRSV